MSFHKDRKLEQVPSSVPEKGIADCLMFGYYKTKSRKFNRLCSGK